MVSLTREERRQRILQSRSLQHLLNEPGGQTILEEEAHDDDGHRLIEPPQLQYLLKLRDEQRRTAFKPQLFGNLADVIIVPGFLGSSLSDVNGGNGLIWIDPSIVLDRQGKQLGALQLSAFKKAADSSLPEVEVDIQSRVKIEATGALPAMYDLLAWDLEFRRYGTSIFPFDWRKDLEYSAQSLANHIRARHGQKASPLHIIAHSQGSLVARRALQLLGPADARSLVNNLVLLGPASFGSFSAAFAFTGDNSSIEMLVRFGVKSDFRTVLQSFTGLYQLLPWNKAKFENGFDPELLKSADSWALGIDKDRLKYGFGWAARIDTQFFNDRTSIILGDVPMKGAIEFEEGHAVGVGPDVAGDGTVTDANARLPGVRTYRMHGGKHAMLAMYPTVMAAVRSILKGEIPALSSVGFAAARLSTENDVVVDLENIDSAKVVQPSSVTSIIEAAQKSQAAPKGTLAMPEARQTVRPTPLSPNYRRLRVFSFDPLMATNLEGLCISTITVGLPWDGNNLLPGPIGDYIEVIDYDPNSRRFYHPVDLTDPRLVAQDGLPPAESNPQFHQQMTYAVAMATVVTFEHALGRSALWAPHFERDEQGEVMEPVIDENTYVPRLRIYPHAFRDANAFYDPERHAILFGYFPSHEQPGGETLPGGVVFTCQSFDIIAHETTHALLHGLHRYYLYPSNPDVLAFHEAFADAVALFQKFSFVDVVKHQIARTRGDLRQDNLLGQLAQQFGAAMGDHRGALRQYINRPPDPSLYASTAEPHDRGAILMAALFRAFLGIYEHRTKDLYRIADAHKGRTQDDDIAPDLVNRLAEEACKAARHFLTMCVRALDYVPPIDLTFGEYLRALITADYELVRDDDLHYRVAVIDAFRSWGLYPSDVNVLDQTAMLWRHPSAVDAAELRGVVDHLRLFTADGVKYDRREIYLRMRENCHRFREWIYKRARAERDGNVFGVMVFGRGYHSIPRNKHNAPKFEVHSVRTCLRIGPDGQQQNDLVVEIVQRRAGYFDEEKQRQVDAGTLPWEYPDFWFRGGCTLIIEPGTGTVRYSIYKSVLNDQRLAQQREFESGGGQFSLAATYFDTSGQNPFALLHSADSEGTLYG